MLSRWALVVVVVVPGCGRVDFDLLDDSRTDDGRTGDGQLDTASADPALLYFAFESGGFLVDSATGHDGTCVSCPVAVPGRAGGSAALFDGTTTCVHVPLELSLRPSQFTFAAWVRIDTDQTQTMFTAPLMGDTTNQNSFEMYQYLPVATVVQTFGSAVVSMTTPVGEWHHLAGTYDGAVLTGYRDGVMAGQVGTAAPGVSADPLLLGCDRDSGAEMAHFSGALDDVRFYSRALSTTEIAALAQ